MTRFTLAATGGTFDIIHKGHLALLAAAFTAADKVIIGLTSDTMAAAKGSTYNNYQERLAQLADAILERYPKSDFEISRLDNDFGPAVLEGSVDALVVSEERRDRGTRLNELRTARGLDAVEIVVIPMVLARDGTRISTTRIKNGEIDTLGNVL